MDDEKQSGQGNCRWAFSETIMCNWDKSIGTEELNFSVERHRWLCNYVSE